MPCHASPAPDPACPCRRAACPSHTLPSPRPALRHLAPPLRRPCPAMPRRRAAVPTRASPAPVHAQPCPSPFIACPGHRHADLRPASAIRDLALACHRSSMLRQRLAQHTIASPSLYLASSRRTVPCRCESSPCCAAPMRYFAPPMPCFVLPCLRHPARGPAPRRRARRRAAAPPRRRCACPRVALPIAMLICALPVQYVPRFASARPRTAIASPVVAPPPLQHFAPPWPCHSVRRHRYDTPRCTTPRRR